MVYHVRKNFNKEKESYAAQPKAEPLVQDQEMPSRVEIQPVHKKLENTKFEAPKFLRAETPTTDTDKSNSDFTNKLMLLIIIVLALACLWFFYFKKSAPSTPTFYYF